MTERPKPTIKHHYGDFVEFDCACGEEMTVAWSGDKEVCESCGLTWILSSEVVLVADDIQSHAEGGDE